MSFSVNYSLLRGEVKIVPSGSVADDGLAYVVINSSNTFEVDGVSKVQSIFFKIPCLDDSIALRVADFFLKKFDSCEMVFFFGTFPKDNFVTVLTPCEDFLTEAVEK